MAGVPVNCFENRNRCNHGSYKWLAWTSVSPHAISAIITPSRLLPVNVKNCRKGRGMKFESLRHQLISISDNDPAGIARTACATFLEVAFLVTVGICIGMNNETAAVSIKQAETAR